MKTKRNATTRETAMYPDLSSMSPFASERLQAAEPKNPNESTTSSPEASTGESTDFPMTLAGAVAQYPVRGIDPSKLVGQEAAFRHCLEFFDGVEKANAINVQVGSYRLKH